MENYATKTELVSNLQARGYDLDFVVRNEGILCIQQNKFLRPEAFEIMETYHFEGKQNPYDSYTIYAIESIQNDFKGTLITTLSQARKQNINSSMFQISLGLANMTPPSLLSQ